MAHKSQKNSVGGINNSGESADAVGIAAGIQSITTSTTTGGGVINAVISGNKINGVSQDATFSAAGIIVAGITGQTNTISNNMITGVISDGDSGDFSTGIFVTGVIGSITNVYNNSISMTGDRSLLLTPSTAMYPSYGIAITGTDPTVDIKNNIVYTTQTASGGGVDAKSYAIGMTSTTFVNLTNNYNNYWSTGANDGGFRTGSLDPALGTDYSTVALFATAVGDEANSVEVLPAFVSDLTDLHLNPAASCLTIGKGVNLPSVTTDFDCNSRNTLPFMGAHEAYEPSGATTALYVTTPYNR
ncbi:MAG: hypothetical protein IPP48_15070 [Chitinophagaceae bacterium]|nr:hypothetical protein [Chitinophagaceae bacterium]